MSYLISIFLSVNMYQKELPWDITNLLENYTYLVTEILNQKYRVLAGSV